MKCDIQGERLRWYVIHTKPKQEVRAASNLRAWNVETFTPQIRERRYGQYPLKPTSVIKPLFPRYIFAKFDIDKMYHKVYFTRGIHCLLCFGDGPVAIDDEVISLIQSQSGSDGFIQIGEELKLGDRVMIKDGYLKNLVGIFDEKVKDNDRISILLTTISYQSRVIVNRDMVKRIA
jgi:transcriptional antiterminator RfaH